MTETKPPAASPDLDELAARLWRDLPGNRQGDLIQIRAYFAKVAKKAQLRLLDKLACEKSMNAAPFQTLEAMGKRISKEGPL